MRITAIKVIPLELKLKEIFSITNETVDVRINVFIKIETNEGIIEKTKLLKLSQEEIKKYVCYIFSFIELTISFPKSVKR